MGMYVGGTLGEQAGRKEGSLPRVCSRGVERTRGQEWLGRNLSHLSPVAGGIRGRRKRNPSGRAPACAPKARPRFHPSRPAGGWQAGTLFPPWHSALRRCYSERWGVKSILRRDNSRRVNMGQQPQSQQG